MKWIRAYEAACPSQNESQSMKTILFILSKNGRDLQGAEGYIRGQKREVRSEIRMISAL